MQIFNFHKQISTFQWWLWKQIDNPYLLEAECDVRSSKKVHGAKGTRSWSCVRWMNGRARAWSVLGIRTWIMCPRGSVQPTFILTAVPKENYTMKTSDMMLPSFRQKCNARCHFFFYFYTIYLVDIVIDRQIVVSTFPTLGMLCTYYDEIFNLYTFSSVTYISYCWTVQRTGHYGQSQLVTTWESDQ